MRGTRKVTHSKLGQNFDGVSAAVLNEGAGNDLHGVSHCATGQSLDAFHVVSKLGEGNADGHLCSTSARCKLGVEHDVAGNRHGIL